MFVRIVALLVFAGSAGLPACTSYEGLRIVEPAYQETVTTLRPTLRWDAVPGKNLTYDVVLYEGEDIAPVYQREGLGGTTHRVEQDLKPGTRYRWSVRTRQGDSVSEWSQHQTQVFTGVSYHSRKRMPEFTTPAKA
jgi:hypothetical protein